MQLIIIKLDVLIYIAQETSWKKLMKQKKNKYVLFQINRQLSLGEKIN